MNVVAVHPRAACIGFLCVLPFFIANFIVTLRIEPFYAWLDAFPIIRSSPILPLLLLLFFPVGGIAALYPTLSKERGGIRKIYILNTMLSALLLGIFLFLFIPLAKDMYTCDILKIPNCD